MIFQECVYKVGIGGVAAIDEHCHTIADHEGRVSLPDNRENTP
jgi:hypothetical protein